MNVSVSCTNCDWLIVFSSNADICDWLPVPRVVSTVKQKWAMGIRLVSPPPCKEAGFIFCFFLLCWEVYQKKKGSASFASLSTAFRADLLVLSLSRLVPSANDTLKAPALVGSLFRPDRYRIVMNYIHELSSIDPLKYSHSQTTKSGLPNQN